MSEIRVSRDEPVRLPLSFGQEQLWFLYQLAPGRSTYNVAVTHRLTGPLDTQLLHASLTDVVRRHESLRTTAHADDGAPYLVAGPPGDMPLHEIDLSAVPPDERAAAETETLGRCTATPFDLSVGPLYRYTLVRLGPTEHILSQVYHHMVIDGWSAGLINAELSATYTALRAGRTAPIDPPAMRYADFAARQREQLTSGELAPQLEFWQKHLADLPALELPADRSRPAEQTFAGGMVAAEVPANVVAGVRALARQEGVSLFMLLAAALAVLLARYTGQDDVPFGTAALGRTDPDLEDIVGFFTNMVVLRADLTGDPTFIDLLERVAGDVMDAYDNQDAPFERVVDRAQPVRDLARNPLFGVAIQLISGQIAAADLELPDLLAEAVDPPNPVSRFDLAMNFVETPERLRLTIEYSMDLFERWRVEAFADHLIQVLAGVCADPSRPVSLVPVMSGQERATVLAAGRGRTLTYGQEPVHTFIARRAAEQPDHLAAVFEGRELSYGELDRRAAALAGYLRANGIRHEQIVAVAMERDLDALVALLGVLKAGAAFTVLDPSHPPARLEYMLRDTAAPLVLTQSRLRGQVPTADDWRIIAVDGDWADIEAAAPAEPLPEWADRDSLAYVLYTSGSTGRPKGVLLDHRALMSFIESYRELFELTPADRMLQLAALAFDMSQGEIFTGLCVGATLVLVDQDAGTSPDALAALMRDQRTSYICMSPAMLSLVEPAPYPDLRKIMAGGEAVPAEIVNKWNLDDRRLINVYGPTEAAVGCTAYVCPHVVHRTAPPIGTPFPDRRMYIVDRFGNLLPRGVPGELLIGGDEGLARGYLNQPDLTNTLFVDDPFHTGGEVYRSGDLVRWNHNYQLEFLGRLDNQIKLRGLRIELEEIESALLGHVDVAMAAVALSKDERGEPRLVGYVTPAGDRAPDPVDLRAHLADRLPDYMVPTVWVVMDRLPLTTARKVNRSALPDPEPSAPVEQFVAPATPTEHSVGDIFTEVLGDGPVSVDSGFFTVGGNSLQALRVVSRLNRHFGVKFKLRMLFGNPTVRGVASVIDDLVARGGGNS